MYSFTLPIDTHYYSDVGYRFRKNSFGYKDYWYPEQSEGELVFFDLKFFN